MFHLLKNRKGLDDTAPALAEPGAMSDLGASLHDVIVPL